MRVGEGKKELFILFQYAIYNAAVTFKTGGSVLAENIEGVWIASRGFKSPGKALEAFCARSPEQAE